MDVTDIAKATITLFAVVNPIGSIPIFIQLTGRLAPQQRRKTFRTGALSATLILVAFAFLGEPVLTRFFQIRLTDLMAAGGLLLLVIAIDHLVFGSLVRSVSSGEGQDPAHIGAVPIACPILAGPGAMMTVLLIRSEQGLLTASISLLIVMAITWLILRFSEAIHRLIGETVCTVLSKVLCLFIAAIGMNLLLQGLAQHVK